MPQMSVTRCIIWRPCKLQAIYMENLLRVLGGSFIERFHGVLYLAIHCENVIPQCSTTHNHRNMWTAMPRIRRALFGELLKN